MQLKCLFGDVQSGIYDRVNSFYIMLLRGGRNHSTMWESFNLQLSGVTSENLGCRLAEKQPPGPDERALTGHDKDWGLLHKGKEKES